jgi:hypothetical protein
VDPSGTRNKNKGGHNSKQQRTGYAIINIAKQKTIEIKKELNLRL